LPSNDADKLFTPEGMLISRAKFSATERSFNFTSKSCRLSEITPIVPESRQATSTNANDKAYKANISLTIIKINNNYN